MALRTSRDKMRLVLAFIFTLAVAAWGEKDILGTFKATGAGRHDFAEIHFGKHEALIKKREGRNAGSNLVMGHWYTSGNKAVILEGSPGVEDHKIPFEFITKDTIVYHCTTFVRAKAPTDLDALAMVGYGHYSADNPKSNFYHVTFTEGKMTMQHKVKGKYINYHGNWKVNTFTTTTIDGVLEDVNTHKNLPVHILKKSPTQLVINKKHFSLEEF